MSGDDPEPTFIPIDDPDDPRIEPYRAIRERDLVGRQESFIAEGAVVIGVLLTRSRYTPSSLLIAENRVEAARTLLEQVPFNRNQLDRKGHAQVIEPEAISCRPDGSVRAEKALAGTGACCPVYVASRQVMDQIAGFPLHRGLLAHGVRGPLPDWRDLLPPPGQPALIVGLVGLANHDNVGGIFRNAAAFGADAVLIDPTSCDPLYRKAIRVSVGASLMVPFARFSDPAELAAGLRAAGITPFALATDGAQDLAEITPPARAAVFLGAEGPGLPDEILALTETVRIPIAPGFDSLNVATTAGIALHHFSRPRHA